MFRFVSLLALVGCGRIGFDFGPNGSTGDARGDGTGLPDLVAPLGHDEDADGVVDVDDTCPHLVAAQTDRDGDTVGDDCDPYPDTPGESIALFATMVAGDQPFTVGTGANDGTWTQLADSVQFSGALGTDLNLMGEASLPIDLANVTVAMGIDITEVLPGSASGQNQVALGTTDQVPRYVVELNQITSQFDVASITHFDGANYTQTQSADLANGIHPGPVFFRVTQQANVYTAGEISWPGEPYTGGITDNVYQGANLISVRINNVHLEIRYLIVIRSAF